MIRRRFQEISTLALLAAMTAGSAMAQEALPDIEVGKPKPVPSSSKPKPAATHVAAPPPPVVAAAPQSEVQRAEEKFNATQEFVQRNIHHRQGDQRGSLQPSRRGAGDGGSRPHGHAA